MFGDVKELSKGDKWKERHSTDEIVKEVGHSCLNYLFQTSLSFNCFLMCNFHRIMFGLLLIIVRNRQILKKFGH